MKTYKKTDFIRVRNLVKAWIVVLTVPAPDSDWAVARANMITDYFKQSGKEELIQIAFQILYAERVTE